MGNNSITVQLTGNKTVNLHPHWASDDYFTFEEEQIDVTVGSPSFTKRIVLTKNERQTLLFPSSISDEWQLMEDLTSKPQEGNNAIRFVNGMSRAVNVSVAGASFGQIQPLYFSNYSQIKNGRKAFTLQSGSQSCEFSREFGFGSSYTFLIPSTMTFGTNCQESISEVEDIKPNSVHMALQVPQYFFITAGEVMFSVTGLEFSYSQAPSNMKAVLQAGWLLTVAIGNFIVLIVAELAKIPKKWAEYILFASLLVAVCIIFSIMAYFYTYIDPAEIEAQFKRKEGDNDDDEDTKAKLRKVEAEMARRGSVSSDDEDQRSKQTSF
ncbi:solute carrier family 15 member 1 [Austrofundulus limnaeus]|nr:PREDICTED: solute carrier family 15 member 1-like [Austrofundulus limnaeus]